MANVMPWLLSMSLLGFQQFAAHPGIAPISRELEAPIFPLRDSVQIQIFRVSIDNNNLEIIKTIYNRTFHIC